MWWVGQGHLMGVNCAHVITILVAPTFFGAMGVQITDMRVPSAVRNGSSSALLDCEYTLKPDELNLNAGLVVKWFFNSIPAPVYQWIIGKKPQDLGVLRGKLDLRYRASDNNYTMHRALYIINPTTELSGEYKCKVETFSEEDFMKKTMVVFVPERKLELTTHSKSGLDSVNVTCRAQGVYPEPKMALFKDPDRKTQWIPYGIPPEEEIKRIRDIAKNNETGVLEDVTVEMSKPAEDVYDIVATKILEDEDLQSPTVFECELRIPDANYVKRKDIVYYPGVFYPSTESGGASLQEPHLLSHLVPCVVTLFLVLGPF